jgi:hypothetical protein
MNRKNAHPRLIKPPKGHKRLAAYVIAQLKPAADAGGAQVLWRAAHRLLDILQGRPKCSHVWYNQGITEWNQCKAIEFKDEAYFFRGTTVPVNWLFQGFEKGTTVRQFLTENPAVKPKQVAIILEHVVLTLCS